MTQTMATFPESGMVKIQAPGGIAIEFEVQAGDKLLWESTDKWERCRKCNGTGLIASGELYCDCQIGRDLLRQAKRFRVPEFGDAG